MASGVIDLLQGGPQAVWHAITFIGYMGFGDIVGTLCGVAVITVADRKPRTYQAALVICYVVLLATLTYIFIYYRMAEPSVAFGGVFASIIYLGFGDNLFGQIVVLLLITFAILEVTDIYLVLFLGPAYISPPLEFYFVATMLTSAIVTAISQKVRSTPHTPAPSTPNRIA